MTNLEIYVLIAAVILSVIKIIYLIKRNKILEKQNNELKKQNNELIKTRKFNEEENFKEKRRKEILKVIDVLPEKNASPDRYYYNINQNKPLAKRLLQHLYTSNRIKAYEGLKELYDAIKYEKDKQSGITGNIEKKRNGKKILEIRDIIAGNIQEIRDESKPEFGVCESCLETINSPYMQKYKKTIDLNKKLWSVFDKD